MNKPNSVLIISEANDLSTDDVIGWLFYNNIDVIRINNDDFPQLDICSILNNGNFEQAFIYKGQRINLSDFGSIWYRRGQLVVQNNSDTAFFGNFTNQENIKLTEHFDQNAAGIFQINKYQDNYINKLNVLVAAQKEGLNIPNTYIVTSKDQLPDYRTKKYITKSISEMGHKFSYSDYIVEYFATVCLLNEIKNIPENFFPSLIQEFVEKRLEIRSFYLHGEFRSMAIFSQQNKKTEVDFRNYDHEKPNRCVPFNLPREIENKLDSLMQKLNINSGSIDLILTPQGEYFFLEVNPIGQFQWLSKNCNYRIEELIAKTLAN